MKPFPSDADHPAAVVNWILDALGSIERHEIAHLAAEELRKAIVDEQIKTLASLNREGAGLRDLVEYRSTLEEVAKRNDLSCERS